MIRAAKGAEFGPIGILPVTFGIMRTRKGENLIFVGAIGAVKPNSLTDRPRFAARNSASAPRNSASPTFEGDPVSGVKIVIHGSDLPDIAKARPENAVIGAAVVYKAVKFGISPRRLVDSDLLENGGIDWMKPHNLDIGVFVPVENRSDSIPQL